MHQCLFMVEQLFIFDADRILFFLKSRDWTVEIQQFKNFLNIELKKTK